MKRPPHRAGRPKAAGSGRAVHAPTATAGLAAIERARSHERVGRVKEAIACLLEVRGRADLEDRDRAMIECLLAACWLSRGEADRALRTLEAADTLAHHLADAALQREVLLLRGCAELAGRHADRARVHLGEARKASAAAGNQPTLARAVGGLAELAADQGEPVEALELAAEALAAAERSADPREVGRARALAAKLHLRRGEAAAARRQLRRAMKAFEQGECRLDLAEVYLEYGTVIGEETLRDPGTSGELAAPWLAKALAVFREQAVSGQLDRVRQAFSRYGRRRTDRAPRDEAARLAAEGLRLREELAHHEAEFGDRLATTIGGRLPEKAATALGALAAEHQDRVERTLGEVASLGEAFLAALNQRTLEREQIRTLLELSRRLAALRDPAQVLDETATMVAQLVGADRAVVAELEDGRVARRAAVRMDPTDEGWRGLLEQSITSAAPVMSAAAAPARVEQEAPVRLGHALAVPLRRGEVVLGGVFVDKELCGGYLTEGDLELLVILATQAATVLENARITRQRDLETREREATLDAITDAVLSVSADGRVTAANNVATRLLSLPAGPATTVAAYPGLAFLQPYLEAGAGEVDGRMVSVGGADHLLNVRVVTGATGQPASHVATLTPMARAQRMAQRLIGSLPRFSFSDVVGNSPAIQRAVKLAQAAALSGSSVLLTGESGTGKEVFAQAIHNAGARREGPFVGINCAAIPRELLESELFGYEGGAFTGAKRSGQPGKFELAEGGTLLLDEIGDMPLEMQAKLLRVLEERRVTRVGGARAAPFDARLIATTNRDLAAAVAQGLFRQDLFFRLRVIRIELPPLRARRGDIPALCRHFVELFCTRAGRPTLELSPEVLESLTGHQWPGNTRELEHVLEAEVNLAPPDETVLRAVPEVLLARPTEEPAPAVAAAPSPPGLSTVDAAVRNALVDLLHATRGDTREMARRLGVSRATVYNKLGKFGIKAGEYTKL